MHLISPEDDGQGHWQGTTNGFFVRETNGHKLPDGEMENPQTCVHQLFQRASEDHRDKIALICGDSTLTYSELHSLSNRIARALLNRGVGHGDIVGVALDRSVEL